MDFRSRKKQRSTTGHFINPSILKVLAIVAIVTALLVEYQSRELFIEAYTEGCLDKTLEQHGQKQFCQERKQMMEETFLW